MPKKLWCVLQDFIEMLGHGTEYEKVGMVDSRVPIFLTCNSKTCDDALDELASAIRYALCAAYEEGRADVARDAARGKPSIAQVDKWFGMGPEDRSD